MILNNRDEIFFLFFLKFEGLGYAFGHGERNDLVFCGLKTFAHFYPVGD